MNKVVLIGRLTKNPNMSYSQASNTTVGRFTIAVNRRFTQNGEQKADFISCVVFGKIAEFAEKYLKQGTKVAAVGRIQTGSYTNRDGVKVYTTDVVLEEIEFAESKSKQSSGNEDKNTTYSQNHADSDGFMHIPEGVQEELPFI